MPRIQLSDVGLRALQPPERGTKDYWDITLPSFGCRISNGGAKTFILKLSNSRRSIGRFPIISLAKAREEAKRLLAEKTLGKVRPQSITVEVARGLFLSEKKKGRRAQTVADLEDRLDRHFSIKGQLADVTHQEIVRRLNKIQTPQEHNAALRVGKTFFKWALNRRYITDNPTTGISPHSVSARSRVLTDRELQLIWQACEKNADASTPGVRNLPASYRTIVKLLILTGQRRNEIASLQASWINEKEKSVTFPGSVTKNGREVILPMPSMALAFLERSATSHSDEAILLFPARGRSSVPFNGWSKSKAALDKLCGVKSWTLHDIRRTYRTIHGRIGTPPHIAERLVNHVSSRSEVEKIYDRHTYLSDMKLAVANYEKYLQSIGVG